MGKRLFFRFLIIGIFSVLCVGAGPGGYSSTTSTNNPINNNNTLIDKPKLEIRPFCAYRPRNKLVGTIASFPYSITNLHDARHFAYHNNQSFLHISHPEVDLPESVHSNSKIRGEYGKQMLQKFIAKRWLVKDQKPSFYVYALEKKKSRHVGIIAEVALKNYDQGLIKRSEQIIPEKKKALVEFIDIENVSVDPVILIYSPSQKIDQLVDFITQQKPQQEFFSQDGNKHSLWLVQDTDTIELLHYYFSLVPVTYIADGHHRTAAAHMLQENRKAIKQKNKTYTGQEPFNYLLAALFPADQIEIYSYNRLIKNLNGLSKIDFLTKIKESFTVKRVSNTIQANPTKTHCFGMFLGKQWFTLTVKKNIFEAYENKPFQSLAMNIFNHLILQPIFNMHTKKADNIEFIGGENNLEKLEQECRDGKGKIAFALCPVSVKNFMELVETDRLMPPKTTWFEPKMRLGLFVRPLDDKLN